jgi:hypothetical protein
MYNDNTALPDLERLSETELDTAIKNSMMNSLTSEDLRVKNEALGSQDSLLKQVINGLLETKRDIDESKNGVPENEVDKEVDPNNPDLITKVLQVMGDIPENTQKTAENLTERVKFALESSKGNVQKTQSISMKLKGGKEPEEKPFVVPLKDTFKVITKTISEEELEDLSQFEGFTRDMEQIKDLKPSEKKKAEKSIISYYRKIAEESKNAN